MDDVITPGFKRKIAKGEILFNPLFQTRRVNLITVPGNGYQYTAITPITCSGIQRKFSLRYDGPGFANLLMAAIGTSGLLPVTPLLSDSEIKDFQGEISTKCLSNRGRAGSNLFESLAEIKQTLHLLRNPFQSMNKVLHRASSLRKRGVSAAETWLQYRYGVLPLVRDITSIISGAKKRTGHLRATSRAKGKITRNSVTVHTMGTGAPGAVVTYTKTNSEVLTVRAVALDEYFVDQFDNIGLSGKNLVTLPWELIPYSFVVDWFLNVGDYLGAMVPLPTVKSLGSCLVTTREMQTFFDPTGSTAPTGFTLDRPWSGQCYSASMTKNRTSILHPSFVVRSDFGLSDFTRLADASALLSQRMNRIFR
jgi:hypothetical protein